MALYGSFLEQLGNKQVDMANDTIKAMLLSSGYSVNYSTHTVYSDISASEVSGTGYSAGGVTLVSNSWTRSGLVSTFDAADVAWADLNVTARYMVLYDSSVSNLLICCLDFGSDQSPGGDTFAVTFNASGIFTLTAS